MFLAGAKNLESKKEWINELNVFPVPDGDTGTNMSMTIMSAAKEVYALENPSMEQLAKAISSGSLRGARGNSGVILSRIFAGIADGLAGNETSDVQLLCRAFESGVKKAYGAVSAPVEGTMLTVFREAAEYVCANSAHYFSIEQLFEDFIVQIRQSLDRTPELLDVLRRAGVVDSGGAGLYYIVKGMKDALEEAANAEEKKTAEAAEVNAEAETEAHTEGADSPIAERLDDSDGNGLGYCTEVLLQLLPRKADPAKFQIDNLTSHLKEMGGESIVAFQDGDIVKLHVHTFTPGEVLAYCQQFGEYLRIKVENMTLQHHNTVVRNRFSASEEEPVFQTKPTQKRVAVVAVATGEGIKKIFSEAGADIVIDGGQSANPSAEAFVLAYREVQAQTVIVLPNNKNIFLTAKQAAELCPEIDVRVFESRSVGEGYAALTMFDPAADDIGELLNTMREGAEGVVTGMISRAVRDAENEAVAVKKDDWIGFVGDRILVSGTDRVSAAASLSAALDAGRRDVLMILCGADASAEEADRLYETLRGRYPNTEVIMLDGEQPIYDFILVFE